jgi:hypothetical protein
MARNALGQFTRRAGPRRITGAGRRLSAGPVQGKEVDGVVTGEAIVLGGNGAEAKETAKAAKS